MLTVPYLVQPVFRKNYGRTLEGHCGGVRCAGRTDLRFADDIEMLEEDKDNLQKVPKRLEELAKRYGMEISREKNSDDSR